MATAAHKRSLRRLVELAAICLGTALLAIVATQLVWFPAFVQWEMAVEDRILAAGERRSLANDFVFVEIDEASMRLDQLWPEDIAASTALTAMSRGFPWPRVVYAEAIDRIVGAGARVVVLDLIFPDAKPGDDALRAMLDRHADRVVVGANFDSIAYGGDAAGQGEITLPADSLIADPAGDPRVGYVNFWPDLDKVVRAARFHSTSLEASGRPARAGEPAYDSLAAATLARIGEGARAPADHRAHNFRFANERSIPRVPFYSLFLEQDWKRTLDNGAIFKDRIVVIGPSAPLLHDFHQTPIGQIEGPLVHINAIAAARAGDFYVRPGIVVNSALLLAAAAAALGIVRRFRHPVAALGVMVGISIAYVGVVYGLSRLGGVMLPVLHPPYTLLGAGVACIAWNFGRERRETWRLRSTLDRYVSRNVVREILDNREDFLTALGGTRKPMAILFSDVRGFTSFSERADAVKVVEQLNEYLAEMVRIIFANHGTVDKFIGDGIMAVWGNVVSEGPAIDAARALRAAVEMRDQIQTLNERWKARGMQEFAVGIGVHHGDAVFGNIGSDQKMEPTVIGDAVNLASRVEGLTKKYGVTICVTEAAASLTGDEFILRSIDLVQVVGRTRPVEIFHPLTRRDSNVAPPWLERYEQAVRDFRSRRFAEAIDGFTECVALAPGDKLCEIYLERARHFAANPPPPDWAGAEIATSK